MKRTPLKRIGKIGRKSAASDRRTKKQMEHQQVTRCEMCFTEFGLTRAHRKKRRFIGTDAERDFIAILCVICHSKVEVLSHAEMEKTINEIVAGRSDRYWQAA